MKNLHEITCQIIGKCLEETNKEHRKKLGNILKRKRKKGGWAKIKYFLFFQPYSHLLFSLICFYLFLLLGLLVSFLFDSILIRLAFIIIYLIVSIIIPLIITILTPKVKVRWDKRWKEVLQKYLEKTKLQNDKNKAKQKFNRAILYYSREGKSVKFLVDLLWGGVIIGCLPDPGFQKALITTSPNCIWNANPLGAIGIIFLPFVYIYNSIRYDIPIAWLENILAQIELEE